MNKHVISVALLFWATSALSQDQRISRSFSADGVSRVIVRASAVEKATVERVPAGLMKISAVASGGAAGHHSPDPNWKETPANAWGFDFVSKRYGTDLVISSSNELGYIHHYYTLEDLRIEIPTGVKLVREPRRLSGNGAPDLDQPKN